MMQLIHKLKEEVYILNKKLEFIRENPEELQSILNMDTVSIKKLFFNEDG